RPFASRSLIASPRVLVTLCNRQSSKEPFMKPIPPHPAGPISIQLQRAILGNSHGKVLQHLGLVVTLLVGLVTAMAPAWGAVPTWSGTAGDTLWSTEGNWSPIGIPGASDNVRFANDGATDIPVVQGGTVNNVVDVAFLSASINSLAYVNTVGF